MTTPRRAGIVSTALLLFTGCLNEEPTNSVNVPPSLNAIIANPITIAPQGIARISLDAFDSNRDVLTVAYSTTSGSIFEEGGTATFTADTAEGVTWITVKLEDGHGGVASGSASINVTSNPATITVAAQLLPSSRAGVECLLFRGQAAENLFPNSAQVINPQNETIIVPLATTQLNKDQTFPLQSSGVCYTKYSGTYRFVFNLTRPGEIDAFTFETTYVQP